MERKKPIFTMNEMMFLSEVLLAALAYYMLYDAGKSLVLLGIGILLPIVEGVMIRTEQDPVRKKILWGLLVATLLPPILYCGWLVGSVMMAEF